MFRFEKPAVWQKTIDLADAIYELTRTFPAEERFGLTGQMRRAAVSISSNIAEGSSRSSNADVGRFVEISDGSLMEFVSQLTIANRQGIVTKNAFNDLYAKSEEVARMLSGLRTSVLKRQMPED